MGYVLGTQVPSEEGAAGRRGSAFSCSALCFTFSLLKPHTISLVSVTLMGDINKPELRHLSARSGLSSGRIANYSHNKEISGMDVTIIASSVPVCLFGDEKSPGAISPGYC